MPTILITGANRGIGLELARSYQQAGWQVIATCRQPDRATDLQALGVTVHPLDVTASQSIDALALSLQGQAIDLLFHNAGIFGARGSSIGTLDAAGWLEVLHTNTVAPLMLSQALLEHILASQQKRMVFMSSQLASISNSTGEEYIYRSSKAALNMAVKSLSHDVQARGGRALLMDPGWVRTDMGGESAPLSAHQSAQGIKQTLDALPAEATGLFLRYDGSELPW